LGSQPQTHVTGSGDFIGKYQERDGGNEHDTDCTDGGADAFQADAFLQHIFCPQFVLGEQPAHWFALNK
jgi:urocanate hydratase